MKKQIRCLACGRRRKPGHEKRCGTDKAYHKDCRIWEPLSHEKWKQIKAERKITKNEASKKAEGSQEVIV